MRDVNRPKPARGYQSAVRQESARRTRQAIITAAGELFVERGYTVTSLADIAVAAGVARPTVFAAFGSKAALLRQVLDQALAGDDDVVAVADRPWFRPVWDATDPSAVLDAYAGVCLVIFRRSARLFEIVRRAADGAADIADLWNTLQDNRRSGAAMIVERLRTLSDAGPLSNVDTATDILWIFNDPALYANLVLRRGWTEEAFRGWLADTMRCALLP